LFQTLCKNSKFLYFTKKFFKETEFRAKLTWGMALIVKITLLQGP
jgi:hypothetical protein